MRDPAQRSAMEVMWTWVAALYIFFSAGFFLSGIWLWSAIDAGIAAFALWRSRSYAEQE